MTCDGFVARVPDGSANSLKTQYPDQLAPGTVVTRCKTCGAFYEIRLPPQSVLAASTAMAVA